MYSLVSCWPSATPESRNGFLVSILTFFWRHAWEQQQARPQGAPLMTFWQLAVGLCWFCLGQLVRILAANLVCILVWILGADFGADVPTGCANFGANFWRDFYRRHHAAESRAFIKFEPTSDPKSRHLSQPKVRFWRREVEQWWAHQLIYGRLMVGSRRAKSLPDSAAHWFFFLASTAPSVWSSVSTISETPNAEKRTQKNTSQDQNPLSEILRPTTSSLNSTIKLMSKLICHSKDGFQTKSTRLDTLQNLKKHTYGRTKPCQLRMSLWQCD